MIKSSDVAASHVGDQGDHQRPKNDRERSHEKKNVRRAAACVRKLGRRRLTVRRWRPNGVVTRVASSRLLPSGGFFWAVSDACMNGFPRIGACRVFRPKVFAWHQFDKFDPFTVCVVPADNGFAGRCRICEKDDQRFAGVFDGDIGFAVRLRLVVFVPGALVT